jgi:hypothetical protein
MLMELGQNRRLAYMYWKETGDISVWKVSLKMR